MNQTGFLLRHTLRLLGLTTLIIASQAALTGCNRAQDREHSHNADSAQQAEAKKPQYTCPMHPQIHQDHPGKCPICGMDLVKADTATPSPQGMGEVNLPSEHAAFHLPEGRQQMIGVKLGTVVKKPMFKSIEAAGKVAFDPELYTAQSEYVEAIKQQERVKDSPLSEVRHSAESMVESAKLRLKILGLSDKQIDVLGKGGASGSNLLIPKPGENLWVYAQVFEMDLPSVQPGLSAQITGGSLHEQVIPGRVVSVDRVINPATRTARVRVQIPSDKAALRPEAFVNVTILSPLGEQVTVPFDAVLDTGKEAWVFVSDGKGYFEPRLVQIRFRAGDEIALSGGVKPGEKIVTSANFLVDSESRLKGVLLGRVGGAAAESTPSCPEGEFWHAEMKHCMKKPGK